jgi:uncharacterized protein YegL
MENENAVPKWTKVESPESRRTPVYLLLDTSSSMEGAPVESLHNALEQFQKEMTDDPFASEVVHVGVIVFGNEAELITGGLVPIEDFHPPTLEAEGVTRLDEAFKKLRTSLDQDVQKPVKGKRKGDGRPIVFVLTDGQPTDAKGYSSDNWESARDSVVSDQIGGTASKGSVRLYDIYAIGLGPDPDSDTLKAISTGHAFHFGRDEVGFAQFVKLVTMVSIYSTQRQAAGTDEDEGPVIRKEDLPPDLIAAHIP